MLRLALAALLLTPMASSCALPSQEVAAVSDEKALYAAEAAYNTVATAYLEGVESGVLKGTKKAFAKEKLGQAYEVLVVLRNVQGSTDFVAYLSKFNTLVEEVKGVT